VASALVASLLHHWKYLLMHHSISDWGERFLTNTIIPLPLSGHSHR
jgi:hypothetical protein